MQTPATVLFSEVVSLKVIRYYLNFAFGINLPTMFDNAGTVIDFLDNQQITAEDYDNGVILFSDLPEGKNLCKISSLVKEGYTGLHFPEGASLPGPISTEWLIAGN